MERVLKAGFERTPREDVNAETDMVEREAAAKIVNERMVNSRSD